MFVAAIRERYGPKATPGSSSPARGSPVFRISPQSPGAPSALNIPIRALDLPRFSGQFRCWVFASSFRGAWGAEPPSTKVLRKRVAGRDLAAC